MNYVFSRDVSIMENEEKHRVILFNTFSGRNIKMTRQCYDVIQLLVKEKMTRAEFLEALYDDEDRDYFNKLIDALIELKILVDSSVKEVYQVNSVAIEVTHRCNLACKHCCVAAGSINEEEYLSTEEMKRVISNVLCFDPQALIISGGEPLVRKDIWELISYIREKSDCHLILMSNGLLINETNIQKVTENFEQIDLSIDGIDEETCSQVRGKGVFSKVIDTVHRLQQAGTTKLSLSMVDTKITHKYVTDFKKLCQDLNVKPIVRSFDLTGRAQDNKDQFYDPDIEDDSNDYKIADLSDYIQNTDIQCDGFSCGAARRQFSVDYQGYLYPCAPLEYEEFRIISLLDSDAKTKIETSEYQTTEGYKNFLKLFPNRNECAGCNCNMFCWNCLHDVYLAQKDPARFKNRCKGMKAAYEIIW